MVDAQEDLLRLSAEQRLMINFHGTHKPTVKSPFAEFMRTVPLVWDETRVLPPSEIGRWVAFARRVGETWYVAVLNLPGTLVSYSARIRCTRSTRRAGCNSVRSRAGGVWFPPTLQTWPGLVTLRTALR